MRGQLSHSYPHGESLCPATFENGLIFLRFLVDFLVLFMLHKQWHPHGSALSLEIPPYIHPNPSKVKTPILSEAADSVIH